MGVVKLTAGEVDGGVSSLLGSATPRTLSVVAWTLMHPGSTPDQSGPISSAKNCIFLVTINCSLNTGKRQYPWIRSCSWKEDVKISRSKWIHATRLLCYKLIVSGQPHPPNTSYPNFHCFFLVKAAKGFLAAYVYHMQFFLEVLERITMLVYSRNIRDSKRFLSVNS